MEIKTSVLELEERKLKSLKGMKGKIERDFITKAKGLVYSKYSNKKALFIGAHPDDIEIGSGGTAAKLKDAGWEVWLCVLTKDRNPKNALLRKKEATKAARFLGVEQNNVIFTDFPDTNLICNGQTISKVRESISSRGFYPDIVFTHTDADSHNDHRATFEITIGAFRKVCILKYAVANSLIKSNFKPNFFMNVSKYWSSKLEACSHHESQHNRIDEKAIQGLNIYYDARFGFELTEPFELVIQEGAEDKVDLILPFNADSFNKFWFSLIGYKQLVVINPISVNRRKPQWIWRGITDRLGVDLLRLGFRDMWFGHNPIYEINNGKVDMGSLLFDSNGLFNVGPALSNLLKIYSSDSQHFRFFNDYLMPIYKCMTSYNHSKIRKFIKKHNNAKFDNLSSNRSRGILTIMRSPMDESKRLIGCMGIQNFGSLGCFKVLIDKKHLEILTQLIDFSFPKPIYQFLVEYDVLQDKCSLIEESLYTI